jgi:hypothetical protein
LPRLRIKGPKVVSKVVLEEDPGAADLGAGDPGGLGALAKLLRMDVQKCCSLLQIEGSHDE